MLFWTDLLEAIMIFCFGLSWPLSIYKSYTSRTAKGKSLQFELFIWLGYIVGIVRKVMLCIEGRGGFIFYLGWVFYVFNLLAISVDMALYFRNRRFDLAGA